MTTEQTTQQLELAAQILRTGHPWELKTSVKFRKPCLNHETPQWCVANGFQVRPILATPPDNRPLHNPDNLTAEQVGVGWRLPLKEESADQPHELWDPQEQTWLQAIQGGYEFDCYNRTYRLPLSIPWPEPQPDPYAALKKAHAEGKVIQECIRGHWIDCPHPTWKYPVNTYRVKPDEKKTVPFDLSDVPPCSVFSLNPPLWFDIYGVCKEGVYVLDDEPLVETLWKWNYLAEKVKINRSIPLTGRWNPDAWEPCRKLASENG